MAPEARRVDKEMGITHEEFFRVLPRVMVERPYTVLGLRVEAGEGPQRLEIELAPEGERRIGPTIAVPVTRVALTFHGYSAAEQAQFLAHFDRQFFRGGG